MKKPTLRLRQVFEGPTHFKVVKPLGNPIKIAKKGLSPNLMGRLRKFARNGEVPEPVEATGDERAIDFETPVEAPIAPLPRAPTLAEIMARPEFVTTQEAVGVPVETIKASDVEQAPVIVPVAPPMTTAAMPRMVATPEAQRMGPPAPVAPVTRRAAAPDEQEQLTDLQYANKLIEEEMAKDKPDYKLVEEYFKTFKELVDAEAAKSQPTTVMPAAPVAAAPVVVRRAPGFAPEISGAPGSLQTETPTVTRRGTVVTAPAVAVPAAVPAFAAAPAAAVEIAPAPAPAPAAAPAAVVTPATPAPTASAVPSAVAPTEKVLTEKAVTASAEKPAPVEASPFEKTLNGLGYTMAQYQAMPAPMKIAAQQAVRATIAAQTAAEEEAKAAEAETAAFAEQQRALKIESDSLQASAKAARETQQKILDEYDHLKNPTTYLGSMSTLGQIGTAISLAAGAFASGMTGMPNFAQKIYDNAIEQDLQAQKRKADSLYQRLVQAGNSVNSAEDLVKAQLKLVGAAELNRRSAQIKLPLVKARIEAEAAKQAMNAVSTMQRVAKDQATMAREAELRPYQIRKLEAEAVIAEGTPARLKEEMRLRREKADLDREQAEQARQDRIAATQDKAEQERIARGLTVGTTELELKSKTGSKDVRDNIAAREQAMMSILKLESLFKKEGYRVFNPLSEARTEAIEELATFIEQYPKAAGFKRAISLSAAKQLKEGLQAPAGGIAFVKKVLGTDPVVAITGIRREVQRSYADQVRSVVRNPQSDAVNNAILSAYAKADEEIKKYEMMQTADESLFSEE